MFCTCIKVTDCVVWMLAFINADEIPYLCFHLKQNFLETEIDLQMWKSRLDVLLCLNKLMLTFNVTSNIVKYYLLIDSKTLVHWNCELRHGSLP